MRWQTRPISFISLAIVILSDVRGCMVSLCWISSGYIRWKIMGKSGNILHHKNKRKRNSLNTVLKKEISTKFLNHFDNFKCTMIFYIAVLMPLDYNNLNGKKSLFAIVGSQLHQVNSLKWIHVYWFTLQLIWLTHMRGSSFNKSLPVKSVPIYCYL